MEQFLGSDRVENVTRQISSKGGPIRLKALSWFRVDFNFSLRCEEGLTLEYAATESTLPGSESFHSASSKRF